MNNRDFSMTDDLISVAEAATMLNWTVSYIRRLLREKRIEGRKINDRAWMVSRASVEAYATAHPRKGAKCSLD